jgi:hypothetical protein
MVGGAGVELSGREDLGSTLVIQMHTAHLLHTHVAHTHTHCTHARCTDTAHTHNKESGIQKCRIHDELALPPEQITHE